MGAEDKKSLKSETSRKFIQKCIKELDDLDADLTKTLDQLETKARERVIDSYYQNLAKEKP